MIIMPTMITTMIGIEITIITMVMLLLTTMKTMTMMTSSGPA